MPRRCTWHTMMALYIVYRLQEFRFYRASFWTGEGRYLSVAMFQLTVAFTDILTININTGGRLSHLLSLLISADQFVLCLKTSDDIKILLLFFN